MIQKYEQATPQAELIEQIRSLNKYSLNGDYMDVDWCNDYSARYVRETDLDRILKQAEEK